MPGNEAGQATLRDRALAAHRSGQAEAIDLLEAALLADPHDGELLIAHAEASAVAGRQEPFRRIEAILKNAPDWIAGHKALGQLRVEMALPHPFASIETALKRMPKHPQLWMAYLSLLGSAGRHLEAADHAARLRQTIADVPPLRVVEARYAGLGGDAERAAKLLASIPADIPELPFERARNALRMGELEQASQAIDRCLDQDPRDMGAWALAELCWRANDDKRHEWLLLDGAVHEQTDLGLEDGQLEQCCSAIAELHHGKAAPLGQSLQGGTQTRGDLRNIAELEVDALFEAIDERVQEFSAGLPHVPDDHPLVTLKQRIGRIITSWSIRFAGKGHHISHMHDNGLLSSAAHLRVPHGVDGKHGALELGRPPQDITLDLPPLARYRPRPGHLVLFPSFLYHGTTEFEGGERLTVAFDVA